MTISKGADWGETVDRPDDLRIATDDRDLAQLLSDGTGRPTAVAAGDIHRTVGARSTDGREQVLALPLDLVRVTLDDSEAFTVVAHVLARSPWTRGGWWMGEALAVMNAEFVSDFDVAPRGHPNDGRVETLHVTSDLGIRQRWEVRRRLPGARHLPHPGIATRPVRDATWDFDVARTVVADGRTVGSARRLRVEVVADAAVLYA
ncbi:MAG: hypothetical protein ABJH68_17625 [Ilumatobacter sp.]|uniref:hypothetical protein n=1 Tax=Ilumatobacter sp. TaxID=1967498 RepID=UPI0032991218